MKRIYAVAIAAALAVGTAANATSVIYQIHTSAWAAGKAEWAADAACFVDAYGSVKNVCSTNRTWVVSVPNATVNLPVSTTYVSIGQNAVAGGTCNLVVADISSYPGNGPGVGFGPVTPFLQSPGMMALGNYKSYNPSGYLALSVYCSIPPNGIVGPVWAFQEVQ